MYYCMYTHRRQRWLVDKFYNNKTGLLCADRTAAVS